MSRDYKLNKSELTRLKREEKLFAQYLPVLKLKQEQLQIEHNRIKKQIDIVNAKKREALLTLSPYIALFSDAHEIALSDVVKVDRIHSSTKTIAGIIIKTFASLTFVDTVLPIFHTAPWLVRAQPLVKSFVAIEVETRFLLDEQRTIKRELRKATQKVNLFDKVLIPRTKDGIKRIKIALGDEHVAMVTRGKIAKAKMRVDSKLKVSA